MGALIWLIAGVVCIGLELAVGELTLLMLGLGALATAGVAVFHVSLVVELAVFVITSVALLFFLKPILRKQMTVQPVLDTSVKALAGSSAEVLEPVGAHGGQVRLDGSIWSAHSLDPNHNFAVGERVSVVAIDGTTAIVWKEAQ